jgi:RNA ligase (TIGR02306 family)
MNLATVEKIEEVVKHPNADKLDLVRVLNYWCIVGRDQYRPGELIVFIQPDSILPGDKEWAAPLLRYAGTGGRIKAVRLRGEWSMGLIIDPFKIGHSVGDDVTEELGITKYEPPLPGSAGAKRHLPFNIPRTDEERWQNLRNLDKLLGQEVVVTLKKDGMSFTAYQNSTVREEDGFQIVENFESGICSRSLELKIGEGFDSAWHQAEKKYDLLNKMRMIGTDVSYAIRGEVCGPGIQSFAHNPNCQEELNLTIYSVWDIEDGCYLDWDGVEWYAKIVEVPTVPVLERTVLTRELINKYDHELETIDGKPFEGVVVKGKDFSFKIINKHYDAKKG